MTGNLDECILRAEQVTKVYPGTVALNKVDFNVHRGKVNVLVGENGAGKSTLMKIIAGVEDITSGRLLLEGKPVRFRSFAEASSHGIGIIYQELNLFPNLNVAENIFINRELTKGKAYIDHRSQNERAAELMARLEQPINPKSLVSDLRIGQQQIVEIAKALAQDVNILIMDEPTSALSNSEAEVLFRIIGELKSQGVSIIYISHRLEELMRIGDHITVLRDGCFEAEARVADIDISWIISHMVGDMADRTYHSDARETGPELLRVEAVSLPRRGGGFTVEDVSFSLRAGEIVGLYGLMGAGRSELFECLIGLHRQATGKLYFEGREVKARTIGQRIKQGLALIPEDRQREGLVQILSVSTNMTLASLWRFVRGFHISEHREKESVGRLIGDLSIKVADSSAQVSSLSGGNQQKVVIGKGLLTNPRVLLMDEPTRGIDVGAKADVFTIMKKLADQGLAIIFVTSELKEIMAISDRVLVMSHGRITGEFDRREASEEALVAASAVGHGMAAESLH